LPVEHSVASWRMRISSLSKWNSSCFELLLSGNGEGYAGGAMLFYRNFLFHICLLQNKNNESIVFRFGCPAKLMCVWKNITKRHICKDRKGES